MMRNICWSASDSNEWKAVSCSGYAAASFDAVRASFSRIWILCGATASRICRNVFLDFILISKYLPLPRRKPAIAVHWDGRHRAIRCSNLEVLYYDVGASQRYLSHPLLRLFHEAP